MIKTCPSNLAWVCFVKGLTDLYLVSWGPLAAKSNPATNGRTFVHPERDRQDSTFGWICTCPSATLRRVGEDDSKLCKHIQAVQEDRCGWNGELKFTRKRKCPGCGETLVSLDSGERISATTRARE